jgi:hypothetical protein
MQKFTRALTREIELGGERLAVTLSEEGITVRPVGSRRPPASLSWAACICASVGQPVGSSTPTGDELANALNTLRGGKKPAPAAETPSAQPAEPASPAMAAEPASPASSVPPP